MLPSVARSVRKRSWSSSAMLMVNYAGEGVDFTALEANLAVHNTHTSAYTFRPVSEAVSVLPTTLRNRISLWPGLARRIASRSNVIPLLACMPSTP